jgi:hypothetical protein
MATTPPKPSRLTIDLAVEVRQRLRLVAAHRDVTIREYVLTAAADPVLAQLFDNEKDTAYDDL